MSNPNKTPLPEKESSPHQETVQFRDGRRAMWFKTPGDRITWAMHSHTRYLQIPGMTDTTIVSMESGRKFALGEGLALMIPSEFDEKGKFKYAPGTLAAKPIVNELPDLTIGEPWELIDDSDRVKSVLIDSYKYADLNRAYPLVDKQNPFDYTHKVLAEAAANMEAAGKLQ